MIFNENTSWYLDHNIQTYTSDPKGVNRQEFNPIDTEGAPSATGTGFVAVNQKGTINGYIFANMPMMTMKKGERVRWYGHNRRRHQFPHTALARQHRNGRRKAHR